MSGQEKKEQEIMNQEMSLDEMEDVSGGAYGMIDVFAKNIARGITFNSADKVTLNFYNEDGSINCAATVEDGSWCHDNDACYTNQMDYQGMKSCSKAWK